MAEFRQGEGQTKRIRALGPTTRADGTPLAIDEIAHYLRHIDYMDPDGNPGAASAPQVVTLIEDASTPEYDGEFDELIYIDSQAAGTYTIHYQTVDTGGRESDLSAPYTMVILPPLAIPNPPTNMAVEVAV